MRTWSECSVAGDALARILAVARQVEETPPWVAECPEHGEYQRRLIGITPAGRRIESQCPQCAAQAAPDEHSDGGDGGRSALQERIRRAGVPERFVGRSFDAFEATTPGQRRALTIARRLAEPADPGASAIFAGLPGTGKTHLACAIAGHRIAIGESVLFFTAAGAVRYVRTTYDRGSAMTEDQAISQLCGVDLLILDEVGVAHGSQHALGLLFEVINERYAQARGTILASMLTPAELLDYLGAPIIDRFKEIGVVVTFDWESYRGRK